METGHRHHLATGAVRAKARRVISDTWQSQANLSLFLVLIILLGFVFPAMGFARDDFRLYSCLGFTLMLISGTAIAWGHRKLLVLAGFVSSATIAVLWMNLLTPTRTLEIWANGWAIAAILVIALVLLVQVFGHGRVTHVRIEGAIAAYLLLGTGWSHAYHLVEILQPGSFTSSAGGMTNPSDWAYYYSFVTLSTVGYGDITSIKPMARILSVGEALTGQLYLAVLIARLVAMEVISWQEEKHHGD